MPASDWLGPSHSRAVAHPILQWRCGCHGHSHVHALHAVHEARSADGGHDRLDRVAMEKHRERGAPGTMVHTKKPEREWPPGDSLFSTLFYVAARGGK